MENTRTLVFEIGTEELPSAALDKSCALMEASVIEGLNAARLEYEHVECIGTPRRITTFVYEVAHATEAVVQHHRGPATASAFDNAGNPTKAAEGFARSKGVSARDLVVREQDGKSYVWVDLNLPSETAESVLQHVLADAAQSIPEKLTGLRTQRWGTLRSRFSRPVRWLLCLLGDTVVPVEFCGCIAGRITRGNRLMNPEEITVSCADAYRETLRDAHVVVSGSERADIIRQGIAKIEEEYQCTASTPKKTFEEVVNLVEWPTVLVADFDEEFLEVPHEIICESMLSNQRYFPLYDASGSLTQHFIIVSNGNPACNTIIAQGNERVVRARLADAKFFYEEDLKLPLESYVPRLASVGFQEQLGSMLQKTKRIERLAKIIAHDGQFSDVIGTNAARAGLLCKADLVSGAVVEFTNQQGVMGGYYAAASGEDQSVACAISEHYRPRFAGDDLPSQTTGRIVAMADKLDTVAGIFAIDAAPTGSSDPFAVRRSALGVIAICRAEPTINLSRAIDAALCGLSEQGIQFDLADISSRIQEFFAGRLSSIAKDEGMSADTIDAVNAVGVIAPVEFLSRVHALEDARKNYPEVFDDLSSAYTRANNLRDESIGTALDSTRMSAVESELADAIERVTQKTSELLETSDGYSQAIAELSSLRGPIDAFFNDVMVMDDDPALRTNRLALLNRFVQAFHGVADIGRMEKRM